ncbi:MAG: transporter substrate-binding domain-containing protein [Alphaproteobacteria bacterium]|nr:transporter substrate-binding domain-containing protein [Alphaproteobacteria bacterium]
MRARELHPKNNGQIIIKPRWWALTLAVVLLLTGGHQARAAGDEVKYCIEGNYPPFSAITPSGKITGFDVDMANSLITTMGKKPVMVKMEWDGMIPALLAKKCDAIVSSMAVTADRKKKIDFTEQYYGATPRQFVGKKAAKLNDDHQTMKDKVVGVQRATIDQEYITKVYPEAKIRLYAAQEEANADLIAGRVDAIFQDSVNIIELLKTPQAAGLAIFGKDHYDPIFGDGAGIGIRKEDKDLRLAFNKAIKDIRKSGEYKKINDKYFTFDIYSPGS